MTKPSYVKAANKKAVREFIFSHFQLPSVIGLAGPDINEYIEWCHAKGIKDVEIWENTPDVMMQQMMKIKHPVTMKFGNILNAKLKDNVLYDLDYCVTVKYMKEHIQKFKKNFIMTFSRRIKGEHYGYTINKFFEDRKEKIVSSIDKLYPVKHTIFTTNIGKYIYTPYWDTSAMCCITKIK